MSGRRMMAAAMLMGLALTSAMGCVGKDKYDELYAAYSRCDAARSKALADLQAVREENDKLKGELAARDAVIAGKDKIIANLTAANDDLRRQLTALESKIGRPIPAPGPIGGGPLLPPPLDAALKALADKYPELFEYLPEYGMIKLKADPTFDPGSTDIKPGALAALKKLAEVLNTADAKPFNIYIAGHTDDIPLTKQETKEKHGSNWGLAAHRALAVVEALFKDGVDQPRMGALSFSKYHPAAANAAGNKGNAANRRVELWIVPPGKFLTMDKGTGNTPVETPTDTGS